MKVYLVTAIYLFVPLLLMYSFHRFPFFKKIGTIILAYGAGILLSFSGLLDMQGEEKALFSNIQKTIMNLTVPIAIPLMLFSSDFKLWSKTLKKSFASLLSCIIGITTTVFLAYFLFRGSNIPELWKSCGLMLGISTGGTLNFAAVTQILKVSPNTFSVVLAFQMIVGFLFLLFIIFGGFKFFRKILPFDNKIRAGANTNISSDDFENYGGMLNLRTLPKLAVALLLSIGILGVGAGISLLFGLGLNELVIILTITTLSLAASFNKKIREIPKTFELGMFFILVFSLVVSSMFNINELTISSINLLWFISFIIFFGLFLSVLLARLFKVEGDLFTVSYVALIFSPPFVPTVVASMGNKKVLISGIVIGLIGYAMGTYLAVAVAELLHWIG